MQTTERRVLRPQTVANRLDISTSTLWQWVKKDETFPRFFKLGPGSSAMWADELESWIEQRANAQQAAKPAAGPGRPRKTSKRTGESTNGASVSAKGGTRSTYLGAR